VNDTGHDIQSGQTMVHHGAPQRATGA
jgi:hypothetical protein